jgi:hypothetical protein
VTGAALATADSDLRDGSQIRLAAEGVGEFRPLSSVAGFCAE